MKINTSQIDNCAKKYKEAIDSLSTNYNKITNSINNLKTGWQGEKGSKADRFYTTVEKTYLPELQKAINDMNEYYVFLSNVSGSYSVFDSSYASKDINV